VYLAIKHIFPDVPINAGTFAPLKVAEPEGTFLYARYPRPVSGCAAEVSQRIAEAVFNALTAAIPEQLFAAPAGTSGNLAIGGHDPRRNRSYVMYLFTGGGYGGSAFSDGISNGCSTIGISKMPPIEVMEQYYPVLFEEFSLYEGSGGAGEQRGGFGVNYAIRMRRGPARASMVMDHGRTGPLGALGGNEGGVNKVAVEVGGATYKPPHLSKDQDIQLQPGDCIRVSTPGGGGYGDPRRRDPAKWPRRDVATCGRQRSFRVPSGPTARQRRLVPAHASAGSGSGSSDTAGIPSASASGAVDCRGRKFRDHRGGV
jgi:N-methylhydantoinase B